MLIFYSVDFCFEFSKWGILIFDFLSHVKVAHAGTNGGVILEISTDKSAFVF